MFNPRDSYVFLFCLFLIIIVQISPSVNAQAREITISIQPAEALYGTPFSMTISGLKPGEEATLKARSIDGSGIIWVSTATFKADGSGVIDLSKQAPLSGDYEEPDVMGPLWSMKPSNAKNEDRSFRKYGHGLTVQYQAINAKGETATACLKRTYQKPDEGLVQVQMDANGCKGFLFYPETGGPFPGIILLSGSGGGMNTTLAKAFASYGFATLALAYFRYPGLPGYLEEIPLENFLGAFEWMRNHRAGHHIYYPDFIPGIDKGVNGGVARDKVKWSLVIWLETLNFLDRHLHKGSTK